MPKHMKISEIAEIFVKGKSMQTPEIDDFNGYLAPYLRDIEMDVNGLKCKFHMPKAVARQFNEDGAERAVGLPPSNQRPAFKVDEYPTCPTGWMHGSGKAGSFFVPVQPEHGMWLDFNANNSNKYHVAAVVSVQGINPITGRKTDPIRLEQYKTKCPVHDVEFKQDRFCEKCKHKWPGQNYLSSNNGGPFWLDGFMTEEGITRQWYFTEEECKGVAAQLIKDQRVFAIGIAFYLSKEPKPIPSYSNYSGMIMCAAGGGAAGWCPPGPYGPPGPSGTYVNHLYSGTVTCDALNESHISNTLGDSGVVAVNCSAPMGITGPTGAPGPTGPPGPSGPSGQSLAYHPLSKSLDFEEKTSGGISRPGDLKKTKGLGRRARGAGTHALDQEAAEIEKAAKKLEIGAGAKIIQRIHDDPESLEFWRDEPEAFLYINYCDIETCKKILAAGKREEVAEGFMEGLKLAN